MEYQIRHDLYLLKSSEEWQHPERLQGLSTSVATASEKCTDPEFKPVFAAWNQGLKFIAQVRMKTDPLVQKYGISGFREKPANSILRELILNHQDLAAAKEFAAEIWSEDKFYHMLGLVYADQISLEVTPSMADCDIHSHVSKPEFDVLFERFWTLTHTDYKQYWPFYASLCFVRFGNQRGSEFINKLPDAGAQEDLRKKFKLEKGGMPIWEQAVCSSKSLLSKFFGG